MISVGNTGRNDRRWSSSNYGSWVKVAAPGREILSTGLGGTYDLFTGTSQAAPIVSGIAQLLRSQEPGISTTDILARLKATGTPLAAGDQMGPRVDAFGATFNGSFEAALDTWTTSGTARSVRALGPIKPRHGKRMALVTNGPSNESVYGALVRGFFVDPVQRPTGMIEISFRYQYVTEEYPEFVGGKFNDKFQARLQTGSQEDIVIVEEEVNTTKWTRVSGIDFPGGDSTVGKSGWKRVTYTIEAERLVGENFLFFEVFDVADEIYDSAALIDDVRLRVVPQYPRNPLRRGGLSGGRRGGVRSRREGPIRESGRPASRGGA